MDFLRAVAALAAGNPITFAVWSLASAFVLQILHQGYRHRQVYHNLPGPPHSALWGHLKVLGEVVATMPPNTHPQAYYTEIARKYNLEGIFYLDLWPVTPSSIVLSDPGLLDEVTVVKPLRQHQMAEDFMSPIVGPNVIATVNGPIWKRLHNAMAPAFSWSHIRSLTGLMVDECLLFRDALNKHAETGQVFSMEDVAAKLIFDIIGRIVFNFPLHAQTTGSPYLDDLRELIKTADSQTDPTAAYNPISRVKTWWKRRNVLARLDPLILSKIQERLDLLRNEGIVPSRKDPNSMLDLMLREHVLQPEPSAGSTDKEQRRSLTSEDTQLLLTNIKGLLIGGHGTTTDSLCFTLMLLSKDQGVVRKMRQEHDDVFGKGFETTVESLIDAPGKLQELPYTEAVIKEALRLFPVGFGVREADAGATLTFRGRTLPIDKHQAIALNGHDLHYNSKFFPRHAEFRPERWLDRDNEIPRSYFRTFGRGPRACQGQNLAQNELKVILLMIIRDYDFSCVGIEPNAKPRTSHTNLDTIFGDMIYQELAMEAKPRGGMMMTVKRSNV